MVTLRPTMATTHLPTNTMITPSVDCGGHRAPNCASCPQGNGETWCNGECKWNFSNGQCIHVISDKPTRQPTQKQTRKPSSTNAGSKSGKLYPTASKKDKHKQKIKGKKDTATASKKDKHKQKIDYMHSKCCQIFLWILHPGETWISLHHQLQQH